MSRLLCCLRARRPDMGAALSHPQEGDACDGGAPASPPTMADVIRERKKKAGGAGLGTLRRRIAAAARRPRDARPDRGCEHARFIRSVVSSWRLAEVFLLCEELEAGAALRDLATQAELAREPAPALHADLARLYRDRWWCDVEVVGAGWSLPAHRVVLAARCTYFRDLLVRYPNSCRIPLEGVGGALTRDEVEACVLALYAGPAPPPARCDSCAKWERGMNSEAELDIISVENSTLRRNCSCGRPRVDASRLRRLADLLGFVPDALHRDMRYLLDSGELCDARLSWVVEGSGGGGNSYGFRSALELPCHRLLLAARSRFFRSVMSRRGSSAAGTVCVDEKVLPRRFARALLHAAYTDQVDLTLIGRNSSSPSSTNSSSNGGTLRGNGPRGSSIQMLDDAFQLYEIARFLEMPIVAQGCEDAAARALSAETLPHALRWSHAPHASAWLHRQAMRFLRDEFPAVMSSSAAARLPHGALVAALASPFLQASEAQALRALLRWAERAVAPQRPPAHHNTCPEPNIVWHTTHGRRGARARGRRAPADAALRETLADLLPLLRLEHLPPDCDVLQQAVRRGIVPAPPQPERGSADAWLGRGAFRPPRCFLPYLDEIKALLEDQSLPEAELSRARLRLAQRIPDTLYMVAAARRQHEADGVSAVTEGARACVSGRTLAALRARVAELRASAPAQRALRLHAPDTALVRRQIALRAVREMSLPDSCAELLLSDSEATDDRSNSGSLRCASGGASTIASIDNQRAGTCRRELPARPLDTHHRTGSWSRARLSAAVPDVAMAPNANTHLLTARDYPHATHTHGSELVGVLQLDLGDGATHTPRPGSRAQRAARQHREHSQSGCSRRDSDELRAAIELSVMRAYSSLQVARRGPSHIADLLPPPDFAAIRSRATPSPSSLSQGPARPRVTTTNTAERQRICPIPGPSGSTNGTLNIANGTLNREAATLNDRNGTLHDRTATLNREVHERNPIHNERSATLDRTNGTLSERNGALDRNGTLGPGRSTSRSPSPRRSPYPLYALYAQRDYSRSESYGRSARSRGHSPAYA